MKVIDTHLHLDEKSAPTLQGVVESLDNDLGQAGISRGIVLHLLIQGWGYKEVAEHIQKSKHLKAFQNIDPLKPETFRDLEDGVRNHGFIGLKIHPRLQRFRLSDPRTAELCTLAGELNIPVLIDAFPDGNGIMDGFEIKDYANLAIACPNTRFIWAHFGGHYCIDFMMVAKRLKNVFLDISFSWLYYNGSSITQDISYAMNNMRFSKIFYGSDYPDRSIQKSLDMSLDNFKKYGIEGSSLENILFSNAKEFFGWNDL